MAIWDTPNLLSGESQQVMEGELKPEVGLCVLHQGQVTTKWAFMLKLMQIPPFIYITNRNQPYDTAREQSTRAVLSRNVKWVFHMDSDVLVPPDTIPRMIQYSEKFNLPLLSGIYWAKKPLEITGGVPTPAAWLKTGYHPEDSRYDFAPIDLTPWKGDKAGPLVPVDVTGAGCMLIKADVFKKLDESNPKLPYFQWGLERNYLCPKCGDSGPLPKMSEDFYFCLMPGQYVNTHEGHKKIEEIKRGDGIVSHTGWSDIVKNTFCRKYKGKIIEITPDYSTSIKITPNHPIFIRRWVSSGKINKIKTRGLQGQDMEIDLPVGRVKEMWVDATEVREKDQVFLPKPSFLNTIPLKYIKPRINKSLGPKPHRLPKSIELDSEFLWYIGLMIADGHCSRQPTLTLNINEEKIAERAEKVLIEKFGVEPNWKYCNNTLHLVSSHKELGAFLADTIGKKSNIKRLPRFWRRLRGEKLSCMLKGYFEGDGCIYPPSCDIISVATMSSTLAYGVHEALLSLDILNSIRNNGHHTITIPTPLHNIFLSQLKIDKKPTKLRGARYGYRKSNRAPESRGNGGYWVKARNIRKYDYNGLIYNLETEKYNSFTVHSIAVHNCMRAQNELNIRPHICTNIICDHECDVIKKGTDGTFELSRV